MVDTIELKNGFTARIWQDTDAGNPWDEWDCQPPIVVLSRYNRDDKNNLIMSSIEGFNTEQFEELFGIEVIAQLREDIEDDSELASECTLYLHEQTRFEQLDYAERAYAIQGLMTERFSTQDSDGMLVATMAWIESTGIDSDNVQASLVKDARLYKDWCEGNVSGYTIVRPDGKETDSSCGGYYGDNNSSGILDAINESLECEVRLLADDLSNWKAEIAQLSESHVSGKAVIDLVGDRIEELEELIAANTESEGE